MLKDHEFEATYATGFHEPGDFFIDCLMNSDCFDFGLGYFRSTGFKSLAIGFATFLQNGGTMRFIINDCLTAHDKNAILTGQQSEEADDYESHLIEDIKQLAKTLSKRDQHFFNCLSWLVASDRLQIIAVKPRKNKVGIVHHKFGIFHDKDHNKVLFNGSVNFSQFAMSKNVETLWCECSWLATGIYERRFLEMESLFEITWNDESPVAEVIPIENVKTAIMRTYPPKRLQELVEDECQLAAELIREYRALGSDPSKVEEALEKLKHFSESISIPEKNKWVHQDEAVQAFMKTERGVFNMATGTGKTRTALRICVELINKNAIDSIIISSDGKDLLNQWYREILKLISHEKISWIVQRQYDVFHQSEKFRINPINRILLSSRLQLHLGLSEVNGERTLLIHDEVHRLGSEGNRTRLLHKSDTIRYRLGLSATPEREYDDIGTQFILGHIGPIVFEFSLEDAIKKGILAPFNYYPVSYELTDNDRQRLHSIHKRKAALEKAGDPMSNEQFWTALSLVYKTSEGKIPAFESFIASHSEMLQRCIIFVETKEYGEQILEIVHRYRADFHTYFSEDETEILQRFSQGEVECLLTCHKLSEGIDIQSLKNVILLSSAKTRLETIQRIGRCLRSDPENPDKIANVIDFIRENDDQQTTDHERHDFLTYLAKVRPEI
jgi:superfamily II DNA or RNA helicase